MLRKIIAYAGWPKKRLWKSAHRALDTILKAHGETRDVSSLQDATNKLHQGLKTLHQGSKHKECQRCFRIKPETVGIAADAGQFYEVVDASVAVHRMGCILHKFSSHDCTRVVVVERSKKRKAWFSTSCWNVPAGATAWTTGDLFRMFCAAMFMCFTKVGDKIFRLSGLPIGGFHSKVAASAVLGYNESTWCNNHIGRYAEGFRSQTWEGDVIHLRYIDDIILISSVFCCSCLQYSLKCIYSVDFDIEATGTRIPWLDCVANCKDYCVDIFSKPIYPPPPWAAGRLFLKSLFLGRFSRWLQMYASEQSWRKALLALLWDLVQHGWKRKHLVGGPQCIGRLEFQQFVGVGLFLVRHVLFQKDACTTDGDERSCDVRGHQEADQRPSFPAFASSAARSPPQQL